MRGRHPHPGLTGNCWGGGSDPPPAARQTSRCSPGLNLLSSGTNLLEDEEVIDTLDNSKRIADEIAVKQVSGELVR